MPPPRPSLTVSVACLSLILLVNVPADAQSGPITAFTLDSEPGDFIGQGQSLVFAPPNAQVTAVMSQTSVEIRAHEGSLDFSARVVAPDGQMLAPGEYPTARFADATNAGLDVSGDGRGCNRSEGRLTIHRIVVTPLAQEFAASYVQQCQPNVGGVLFGELRYNTTMGYKAAAAPNDATFTSEASSRTIVLGSTGSDALDVQDVIFMISPTDFTIESDTCTGAVISPGGTCSVVVRYQAGGPHLDQNQLRFLLGTRRSKRYVDLNGITSGPETPRPEVGRRTIVKTRLFGEYARRGNYELFHVREGVLQAGFLFPRDAGNRLTFEIQIKRGGWRTYATETFRTRRGISGVVFGARRGTYRANNSFEGNSTFAPSSSGWQYFKITA